MTIIYHKNPAKVAWRAELVRLCRDEFGLNTIPAGQQYWSLCSSQPDEPGAEIVQLVNLEFLHKGQFHGVDRDSAVISANRAAHPEAQWYCGEWLDVLRATSSFQPAAVNLDSTGYSSNPFYADLTAQTMMLCPPGVVLFVNVCMRNPWGQTAFGSDALPIALLRRLPPPVRRDWTPYGRYIDYNTGRTDMGTYIFRRKS